MTVKEIFETMEYGTAPESAAEALAWLKDRGGIAGPYINGAWGPLRDDFDSARKAQPAWAKDNEARARVLYAIARGLQKHSRLLAVMESMDNGKPIREARDIDVPLAIRHFYHHAGFAQLMAEELPDRQALGVCGQIIPWNFPLLMLAWKIAPALAMGNTVVLKPAEYTSLTAMVFAEICEQAGVPKGVANIVTGDGRVGEMIVASDVDKIAFTGSTAVGRESFSTTPIWTVPWKGWSMRSGSTKVRSAALGPGCWCKKAWPTGFTPSSKPACKSCASATRWTSRQFRRRGLPNHRPRGLFLPAHFDHRAAHLLDAHAGGNLWPRPCLHHIPHPGGGRAIGQ